MTDRMASVEIVEASVASLQSAMAAGLLTARALVQFYLDRIDRVDRDRLGGVLAVSPDALGEADARDRERAAGNVLGPLHGIPVLLKDNIESAGSLPTTAGSLALAENRTDRDAHLVSRLRSAGAVILGKANLSEWANFRAKNPTSGWSAVGGQTRNAYDPKMNPCGSSSGSGVAVSASFCAVAIGTETSGSILCPSAMNGVVGLKPTVGLVSRSGIVPISHTQDTAGPIGRSVADVAALLGGMLGADPLDAISAGAARFEGTDYVSPLASASLRGRRLGVVRRGWGKHPVVTLRLDAAVRALRDAGAELVDDLVLTHPADLAARELNLLLYEFKSGLHAYLDTLPDPKLRALRLADLIAFNEAHAAQELAHFGQELLVAANEKGPLTEASYLESLERLRCVSHGALDGLLQTHGLDALVMPSNSPAWPIDYEVGDGGSVSSAEYPAIAGYPNLTVPCGFEGGLPLGLSFAAGPYQEGTLLEIGHAFEQLTRHRVAPEL